MASLHRTVHAGWHTRGQRFPAQLRSSVSGRLRPDQQQPGELSGRLPHGHAGQRHSERHLQCRRTVGHHRGRRLLRHGRRDGQHARTGLRDQPLYRAHQSQRVPEFSFHRPEGQLPRQRARHQRLHRPVAFTVFCHAQCHVQRPDADHRAVSRQLRRHVCADQPLGSGPDREHHQ